MDDPTGIYLHNGYWGGAASLGAGGCMYVARGLLAVVLFVRAFLRWC